MAGDRRRAPWAREALGGAVASVATLAVVLTIGLLGFAPLGDAGAPLGVAAAFVTVTVGGLLFALLSASTMPVAGPSSATALILAASIAPLLLDPAVVGGGARGIELVLAGAGSMVVLMGVLQVAFAKLGLGRMAQFVPQPVLAGFMNGVAVLIFLSQLPALLGLAPGAGLAAWQPATLAIGVAAAVVTWAIAWRWPGWPAQLFGLLAGLGLYAALQAFWPAVALGSTVGPLPEIVPLPDLPLELADAGVTAFLRRHALQVITAATVLALIGALESVLSGLAVDQQLDTQHDAGRDLMVLGLCNIVVGMFSGMPVVVLRARALATLHAGGAGRRSAIAGSLAFGAMYGLLGPWMALLPKAVLAGIMVTVALALVDRWTHRLLLQWRSGERSSDVWQSLATVACVCVLTVWQGLAVGIAAGMLVALAQFVGSMNRSLVRSSVGGASRPSRRVYPPVQEDFLRSARERVLVLELEGALFFGSAERLARELDALRGNVRFAVVDLHGVGTIDASGGMLLQLQSSALRRRGIALLLAGVSEANAHGRRLRAFGCFRESPREDWFVDVDRAVEAAERQMLREARLELGDELLPPASSSLFRGLTAEESATLQQHMQRRALRAGETLFREGDAADSLFVLTRGSITILAGQATGAAGQRFLSFSPGLMLGETAMLDGGGRSASAVADIDAEVWQLTQAALDTLAQEAPALVMRVYQNIALHLAARLRQGTAPRQVARR